MFLDNFRKGFISFIFKLKNWKSENLGFTLVELMVVVAIIGILSAVAVPNFKKYQAKSKTSEAKLQLASIYSAESSFSADTNNFATCLSNMGYNPEPEKSNRYYATGFSTTDGLTRVGTAATATLGGLICDPTVSAATTVGFFAAGKKSGALAQPTAITGTTGAFPVGTVIVATDGQAFTAGAGGYISTESGSPIDEWTITQTKSLLQVQIGF